MAIYINNILNILMEKAFYKMCLLKYFQVIKSGMQKYAKVNDIN